MDAKLAWALVLAVVVAGGVSVAFDERRRRERLDRLFEGREPLSADEFGRRHFSGAEATLAARVRNVIENQMVADGSRLLPDDHLTNDLDVGHPADSMDWLELIMALESEFGVEVCGSDAANLRSIRDVVRYLAARGATCEGAPT